MKILQFTALASCDSPHSDSRQPSTTLERAVAKLILKGATVGISADQMIELLDSGMTVEELLEHVLRLARDLPEADGKNSARSELQGAAGARGERGSRNV